MKIKKFLIKFKQRLYRYLISYLPKERTRRRNHLIQEARITRDRNYFASLKNKHAGMRGFIVGNGPSLKIEDLDRLQGEICIASNKIYLAFDQTKWRPSYHTVADPLVWDKIHDTIGDMTSTVIIPHYLPEPSTCAADVKTFRSIGNTPDLSIETDEVLFSDDLSEGSYGGYTVTFENLQFAVHLGLNPIYIIGCDHYYGGDNNVEANQTIAAPTTSHHFVKNYTSPGEVVYVAAIDKMNISYQTAQKYAKIHGISILNATRGGHLEAFQRVDFDQIVS